MGQGQGGGGNANPNPPQLHTVLTPRQVQDAHTETCELATHAALVPRDTAGSRLRPATGAAPAALLGVLPAGDLSASLPLSHVEILNQPRDAEAATELGLSPP